MAQLQMYTAKLGSPQTTLAATLAADATSMVLTDASVLPAGPNIAVLGVDENCEIVKYTAIDSATNTVSGLVRGQGGSTARVWEAGSVVARNATSLDHDIFKANIEDLATNKADSADVYTQTEIDTLLNAKQKKLTFDNSPTANSSNPVKSNGIKTALDTKQDTLTFDSTPTAESTNPVTSSGVYDAIVEGFRDVYKVTLPSASSSKLTFSAPGITANHVLCVEGHVYYSNPSAVMSDLSITTAANSITITGTLSGTTDIIVTLGIPRTITAS